MKYQIATAGNLKTTVTVDKLAEGLKVEGVWDAAMGESTDKDSYEGKATYNVAPANLEMKVSKNSKETAAELNGAFGVLEDLNIGGLVKYDLLKNTVAGSQFSAAYALSKQTTIAALFARGADKKGNLVDTLTAGFVTKGSPYTFAAQYNTDLAAPKTGAITVGCETKLEGGQIVKAKADTKGTLALSMQHAVSAQFNLCSSVELTQGKDAYSSKFGTELVYSG